MEKKIFMDWTDEAKEAVSRIPFFVRKRVRRMVEEEAASSGADLTVVTSDNPRGEDPVSIIGAIIEGMTRSPDVVEPDRRLAIRAALAAATAGDMVAPPGVDLMSRRIAGMLHASIDAYAAGICLFNLLIFIFLAATALWLIRRQVER